MASRKRGNSQPASGEGRVDVSLLRVDVAGIERPRRGREEDAHRELATVVRALDARDSPETGEEELFATKVQMVGHGEDGHSTPHVVEELALLAERQRPGPRMDAVGADHHVELASLAALERHRRVRVRRRERRDRVAEAIPHVLAGCVVQDAREVAAMDLDVALVDDPEPARQAPEDAAARVDDAVRERVGFERTHDVAQGHARHDVERRAPDVDGVAPGAERGRSLHHGDVEPVALEPVSERGARDARTGDEHVHAYCVRAVGLAVDTARWTVLEHVL